MVQSLSWHVVVVPWDTTEIVTMWIHLMQLIEWNTNALPLRQPIKQLGITVIQHMDGLNDQLVEGITCLK